MSGKSTLRAASSAPGGRRDIARGFKLAMRRQQQGRWHEAEQIYGNILTVCKKRGGREEALALFRRAAADAPDFADVQVALGAIFTNLDHPKEAIACFRKALANAWHALGRSQQEAIWHHARARAINPDFAQAHICRRAVGRWRHYADELRLSLGALEFSLTSAGPRSGATVSDRA